MKLPIIAIASLISALLASGTYSLPAGQSSQPLVIVVRDGVGNPLHGVAIQILLTGPPHQPYDNCVTDEEGQCRLIIPPGAYLIRFERGWRGLEFVSPDHQNSGAMTDAGASGGGFGIYFEPGGSIQYVTFVIGEQDGKLVPLWDMSRDPSSPPQPFAVPDNPLGDPADALAGIDLAPLVGAIDLQATMAASSSPTSPVQVVEDDLQIGLATVPAAVFTPVTSQTLPQSDAPASANILLGILGLVVGGVTLMAGAFVLRRVGRKRGEPNG